MLKLIKTLKLRNPKTGEFESFAAIKGDKGDSVHVAYSIYPDGTNYVTSWIPGYNYIGIAVSDKTPTDKSKYTWVYFKGEKGERGEDGLPGSDGSSIVITPDTSVEEGHVHQWYKQSDDRYKCICGKTISSYEDIFKDLDTSGNTTSEPDIQDDNEAMKEALEKLQEEIEKLKKDPSERCLGEVTQTSDGKCKCTCCDLQNGADDLHKPHTHGFIQSDLVKTQHYCPTCGESSYEDHNFTKFYNISRHRCEKCEALEVHHYNDIYESMDSEKHRRYEKCKDCGYKRSPTTNEIQFHQWTSDGKACELCNYGKCDSSSFTYVTDKGYRCDICGGIISENDYTSGKTEHVIHTHSYVIFTDSGHYCSCGKRIDHVYDLNDEKNCVFYKIDGEVNHHKVATKCVVCKRLSPDIQWDSHKWKLSTSRNNGDTHNIVKECRTCGYKETVYGENHDTVIDRCESIALLDIDTWFNGVSDQKLYHYTVHKCIYCDYERRDKVSHTWKTLDEGVLPTGSIVRTLVCVDCGYRNQQIGDADELLYDCPHSKTTIESKEATCTDAGYTREVCDSCAFILENYTTPKMGHVFDENGVCQRCGPDVMPCNHEKTAISRKYFCDKPGYGYIYCLNPACGVITSGTWELPPSGHIYSGEKCIKCGAINTCTHPETKRSLESITSTGDGTHVVKRVCDVCGVICEHNLLDCDVVNGECVDCGYTTYNHDDPGSGGASGPSDPDPGPSDPGPDSCSHSNIYATTPGSNWDGTHYYYEYCPDCTDNIAGPFTDNCYYNDDGYCVCGYKKPCEHAHEYTQYNDMLLPDAHYTSTYCSDCGKSLRSGSEAHIFDGYCNECGDTGGSPTICSKCGYGHTTDCSRY